MKEMFRCYFLGLLILIMIVQSGCQKVIIPVSNTNEITTITILDYKSRSVLTEYTDQTKIKIIVDALNTFKANGFSEPLPTPDYTIVLKGKKKQVEVIYIHYGDKDVIFIQGEKHEWDLKNSIEDILLEK
jgi:hypothetical protein